MQILHSCLNLITYNNCAVCFSAEPPPQDWVAADRVAEPPPQDWVAADRVAESCPVPPGATTSDLVDFFKRCDLSGALLARAIFR